MALKRVQLHDALSSKNIKSDFKPHIWNQEVSELFKLDSITIKDLGSLNVPMTKEGVASIVHKYQKLNVARRDENEESDCCIVGAENILAPQSNSFKEGLSHLVEQTINKKLGPGLETQKMNIDVVMKGLIICPSSESFVEIKQRMHLGAFGRMLLQLPVHSKPTVSADVMCTNWIEEKVVTYREKPPFHLTFLTGDEDYNQMAIKSLGEQCTAFLFFDLVWLDSYKVFRNLNPNVFVNFLTKAKHANQALIEWERIDVMTLTNCSVDPRNSSANFEGRTQISPLYARKTPALCLPTKHSYYSYELHMDNLKTEDVRMVNLLKLLHYIDVSTVILRIPQDSTKNENSVKEKTGDGSCLFIDWKKEALSTRKTIFSVARWIQGDWTFPALNEKFSSLRAEWHLVGDVTTVLEDAQSEETLKKRARREVETASEEFSYHPAIIIRPRKAAILYCWKHSPLGAVQCLTQRLNSAVDCNYNKEGLQRHVLAYEVNFVLELIVKEGEKLVECQRTAALHQLLYLCTLLKATDEGLKILLLINQRQCECKEAHKERLAGFFGENKMTVEDVITGFVSLAGWEKCSTLVIGMYSRYEKNCDHAQLAKLSNSFGKFDHVDGARIYFAKACLRILTERSESEPQQNQLDRGNVTYFLDLFVSVKDTEERKELYSLLAQVAAKQDMGLLAMIRGYFCHLESQQDDLADLYSTICGLVAQVDCYGDVLTVFEMICFTYRTGNIGLLDRVWSKFFSCDIGPQVGHIESIFSCAEGTLYDHGRVEYKAIGASPLATEHFYKFVEDGITKGSTGAIETSLYHLTIAQKEPSLANEQKFQSCLSIFKHLNAESLMKTATAIFTHNRALDPAHWISERAIPALLECLPPENELVYLVLQDTVDFAHFMYCYIALGKRSSKLRLCRMFEETLLEGVFHASVYRGTDAEVLSTQLFDLWLKYLEMVLLEDDESTREVVAFQTLQYFMIYCDIDDVENIDEEDLRDVLSKQLSAMAWENVLIGLYERERKGASGCLKVKPSCWYLCQEFSFTLASHAEKKWMLIGSEQERIVKLVYCFFWLGSQEAIEQYVKLITSKLPIETVRYCLSLLIVSDDELQACAMGSSYAFSALQRLIRHCVEHLFAGAECSWSRVDIHTTVDRPPRAVALYESERKSKKFLQFKTEEEARQFGESATEGLQWAHYVVTSWGTSFSCEITKLYPANLDDVASVAPQLVGPILSTDFKKLTGVNIPPSGGKCTICLTPSLRALQSER